MNWSQISEEIHSLLVIMSHREWDGGDGGREEEGEGSQTSVTVDLGDELEDDRQLATLYAWGTQRCCNILEWQRCIWHLGVK